MKKTAVKFVTCLLSVLAFFSAKADTIVNGFDTQYDYVLNGIVSDTNWDGVYMRFGDVPNGVAGGSGGGNTLVANTTVFGGGFLGIQSQGGDWSGADNDGFFVYKVVRGDFDVSVESVPFFLNGTPSYDARANNFSGLMVRAYHTNNSGRAFSTTLTNNAENSMRLWRFNQFGIDAQVRNSTNGANNEFSYNLIPYYDTNTFPVVQNANLDTNTVRGFRIVRINNSLSFYTRRFDYLATPGPWLLITNQPFGTNFNRTDWSGVALQVGIAHAPFSAATRDALFDNFELTGTNVSFPPMPASPTNVVTTATNIGGSLTLSWQKAVPSDGSLVVMSSRPIQHKPVQGMEYVASAVFGDTNAIIGGGGNFVVYNGDGNSVTVTNLGAENNRYHVAVYSYVTNSPPVYNTVTPATNIFVGPGIISSVTGSMTSTNIPIGGAAKARLFGTFSTGETNSDVSANPSTSWQSSDTAIATVNAAGAITGVTNGTVKIIGTFGTFNVTNDMTVHVPVGFSDNFTEIQNYLTNALVGSAWDGLYMDFGDVPGAVAGGDGNGDTTVMDAQVTTTNGLTIRSLQSDWQGTANDGPFLFKVVPGVSNAVSGDFTALMHVNAMNTLNTEMVGLMARLYNPLNGGAGPGGAENHANYWKVQNGSTSVRQTTAGGNTTFVATGPAPGNTWLLLVRTASTNFSYYEKATEGGAWTFVTNTVLPAAANNAPMQVGIAHQTLSGVLGLAVVDRFLLDAEGVASGTTPPQGATNFSITLNLDLSMTINYTVGTNLDGTAIRSIVVVRAGNPVSAQPYLGFSMPGNSVFGDPNNNLGGGNYVVYNSPLGDTNTSQSVTVSGLTVGVRYYVSVFTFTGSGTGTTYNNDASGSSGSQVNGFQIGLTASLGGGIPRGGMGQLLVNAIYTGNNPVEVSSLATVSSGNTNIIKVAGGILSGMTNGSAVITASFGGFTNTAVVEVRSSTFSDDFSVSHDYLASGVSGSGWDGFYNPAAGNNPIPQSAYVPLALSGATTFDANTSSNSHLTISSAGDGWENAAAGGAFLFKYVPGDFQVAVHIDTNDFPTFIGGPGTGFNQPGLLARGYGYDTNSASFGTPLGTVVTNAGGTNNVGEYWVSFCRFDAFNIGTYARRNIDNVVSQNTQSGQGNLTYWLLVSRTRGTNFAFFTRLNETDPWVRVPNNTTYQLNQFAGKGMQVGLMAGPWSGGGGGLRTVHFEKFLLDAPSPILTVTKSGGNVILSWPSLPGFNLQSTISLSPTNWQVVGTAPLLTNGMSIVTVPRTNATSFFRLVQ